MSFPGFDALGGWVADYSAAHPDPAALKAAGCIGVVRYAGALNPSFNITAAEVAGLHGHSLPVAIVCEQRTSDILGGRAVGQEMARTALADTRAAGLPDGLVYAACDIDATLGGPTSPGSPGDQQMVKVLDTLTGFADVLGWAAVGFYGSYYACDWLVQKAVPVAALWSTEAWLLPADRARGVTRHSRSALYQRANTPAGIPSGVDVNDVAGDWHPRGAPAPPPPSVPSGGFVPSFTGKNVERLHPVFADQLHQLAAVAGHDIWAQSTGRTDAEQQVLYNGWINRLPGYAPANPPGGPSWHRYIEGQMHAQAADISTVGLGGATARAVFGPHVGRAGLEFAIASESWHIQPAGWVKHPEVPFTSGTTPSTATDAEFIVDNLDLRPGRPTYPSGRSLSVTVLLAALNRHGEMIALPGALPAPTLQQIQGALGDFQGSHLGGSDLQVGPKTKAALAVEPRDCAPCKRLGRYPYKN